MSEPDVQPAPQLVFRLGDDEYNVDRLVEALAFARDFVLAVDIMFAAKNLRQVEGSKLSRAIEDALDMLRDMVEKHGPKPESDEVSSPA